jgi:hypothetical protein
MLVQQRAFAKYRLRVADDPKARAVGIFLLLGVQPFAI